MNLETWSQVIIIVAAIIAISCIPLAIIAIRQERRIKRERALNDIVTDALAVGQSIIQTGEMMAITAPFIEERVSVSTFGDQRRRIGPLAEFLKPETGPIPLPNEHVPA